MSSVADNDIKDAATKAVAAPDNNIDGDLN